MRGNRGKHGKKNSEKTRKNQKKREKNVKRHEKAQKNHEKIASCAPPISVFNRTRNLALCSILGKVTGPLPWLSNSNGTRAPRRFFLLPLKATNHGVFAPLRPLENSGHRPCPPPWRFPVVIDTIILYSIRWHKINPFRQPKNAAGPHCPAMVSTQAFMIAWSL